MKDCGSRLRRIVFPLEGFATNGGIRIIICVANALADDGHKVNIIVPDYASVPPFPLHRLVQLQVIPTRGPRSLRKVVYALRLCALATKNTDISVATGYKTPYYLCASKALRLSRSKLAYLIQHYEPFSHARGGNVLSRQIFGGMAKLGYRLPLKKIAVSRWIKDMIGNESISVISNGIDLETFCQGDGRRGSGEFTIGTIAGVSKWKGYDVFLRAISQIPAQERVGMRVLVASQSEVELPIGVRAQLIRPSNEGQLVDFYRACDVFVCSSSIEGFGLPALEAMACGVPVITTDCGGNREYASPSNCIMVAAGDAHAIADSVIALKRDDARRESLSERSLDTSQRFSLHSMAAAYASFFSTL